MQFRTKARAIELLGKGQIADLPTAITELWKNGYDAYAETVSAELFLKGYRDYERNCFVISDDGTGMTKQDIVDKWLVLGVDSKSRSSSLDEKGENTLWKDPRIKAGEKGIGRLSVAYLGTPVLMLTKKRNAPLASMLVDWRILENYNMFIEDVNIPVEVISHLSNFGEIFKQLVSELKENLIQEKHELDGNRVIWDNSQKQLRNDIEEELNSLILPPYFEEKILSFFENDNSHGTKFVIFNPEEQIVEVVSGDDNKDNTDDVSDSNFVRTSLVGFVNQFKPNLDRIQIKTKFDIYKPSLTYPIDFFSSQGNFFDESDFEKADVIIDGCLDGGGCFTGQLIVYGQSYDYHYCSPRRRYKGSHYGGCPVKLGYSLGQEKSISVENSAWSVLTEKVKSYGGIYLYRDGFRILPYGLAKNDFLRIDERRSKRASSYFFSYRRMFGYIELSRQQNPELKDKSSREGLINNAPYRAFTADLVEILIDLAKTYFSDKATNSEVFLQKKERIQKDAARIKEDEKRTKNERKIFQDALKQFETDFENCRIEYDELLQAITEKLRESQLVFADIEDLLSRLKQVQLKMNKSLPKVPSRFKLSEAQEERWGTYSDKLKSYQKDVAPLVEKINDEVRDRFELRDICRQFEDEGRSLRNALNKVLTTSKASMTTKFSTLLTEIGDRNASILRGLDEQRNNLLESIQSKEDVVEAKERLQDVYNRLFEECNSTIIPMVEHVNRLSFDFDEDSLQGAYKAQYDNIKKQWEVVKETAQLGISVEMIDHEFNVLYGQISRAISNMEKQQLFGNSTDFGALKKSFKSLEDKYSLFSPLYRISGSIAKDIHGNQLGTFLSHFFEGTLKTEGIELYFTNQFDRHIIHIKEPVIYSVLINIINNALYWLRNTVQKKIELDYMKETDEMIIRNSGTPIIEARLERIFELFYTNRPGGRGIGLFLAKQTLNANYFDIYATNAPEYNTLGGACFVIKPLNV